MKKGKEKSFNNNQPINILLIEDDQFSREMGEEILIKFGYTVFSLPDPRNTYDILDKEKIDLIISGIMMPYKDGLTLLKELKTNIKYKHIPFIVWSNCPDEFTKKALDLGAEMYLVKSALTPDAWGEEINKFVRNSFGKVNTEGKLSPACADEKISTENNKTLLILLGLFLLIGWFYWFQYRPAKIKSYCDWKTKGKSNWQVTKNYDVYYESCLHEKGLD